jgi:subfamily B ATP-binding cassette protein MsbA
VYKFWLKLWQLSAPYKTRFILGLIFDVLSGFGDVLLILTIGFVGGVVFSSGDKTVTDALDKLPKFAKAAFLNAQHLVTANISGSKAGLLFVVSLIPLAVLFRAVTAYLSSYLMGWVASRAISDLRATIFEHLINLPLSFLTRNSTGELISRLGDIAILQNMIGVYLVTLIREPISVIMLGYAAFRLDPQLTLKALIALPLCAIPIVIYNKKVRKSGASLQTESAYLMRTMHESFTGIRIIKSYNLERVIMERFRETQKKFISHFMRVIRATESPGPIIETVGAIGIAVLLYSVAGSGHALQFGVWIGSLFAMYRPIKAVVRNQSDLHRARAATERVFELLATKSVLVDPPNPVPLKASGAEICFDSVSFSYGDKLVLRKVQLSVEPGQMVALVGRTGSGKTTLTNLLLRFYDPTDGAIRIGGIDLKDAAMKDLRSQMAVVTQEVILFNDTIRNNSAIGKPGATDKEIEQAARHAFAHDFIMEKHDGYNTVVGEKGTLISGGQRQRIAIARAILKDAPILVLDEATSSLDTEV